MQDCLKLTKKITMRLTSITLVMWLIKNFADYNNINSVNPLYLMINEMIGYLEKKIKN